MHRKILALTLAALMLCCVGCNKQEITSDLTEVSAPTESAPKVVYYANPLTGVEDLTLEQSQNRPVAVMVNNGEEGKVRQGQLVQAGLTKADVVYETEVEGGITRLMAVYQDIASAGTIGTVRSARYPYIDLAMGHSAIYVHHGQDNTYAAPHLKDTQTFALGENNGGERKKNGMVTDYTLYGYGNKIWDYLVNKKYNTKLTKATSWQTFSDAETTITYTNIANTVNVPFSNRYVTVFKYDATSGKYIRFSKTTERKDYFTGESEYFKNVFVLITTISDYPDNYHRKVALTSGTGYYCVNGTYTPIKWSKGNASSSFVFTNEDGTPLTVNQGNSWVCIMGKQFAPSFE